MREIKFEWDKNKDRQNILKHGLSFDTALLVFGDDHRIVIYDDLHSDYEDRYITIGLIEGYVVIITVVYTEDDDTVRIISARKANKNEREEYLNGNS